MAEFFEKERSSILVSNERTCGVSSFIESPNKEHVRAFPHRVIGDKGSNLGDKPSRGNENHPILQPLLVKDVTLLVKRRQPISQLSRADYVDPSGPPPQGKGSFHRLHRSLAVPNICLGASLRHQLLKKCEIRFIGGNLQLVGTSTTAATTANRCDLTLQFGLAGQHSTEAHDMLSDVGFG
nr:hypothetical protein [Microtetraspora malaysiensis]